MRARGDAVKLIEVLTSEKPSATEIPDGRTRIRGSDKRGLCATCPF